MNRRLRVRSERWPIEGAFRISRGEKRVADVVVAEVSEGVATGRGEGVCYPRYGESVAQVVNQLRALGDEVASGIDRDSLGTVLGPGAARNALDCALWDLSAKLAGRSVGQMAGLPSLAPLTTAYTLSMGAASDMAEVARRHAHRPLLKLKVDANDVVNRVRAVREAAPDAQLIVDANEAWTLAQLESLSPLLSDLGVALIEQPLRAGEDDGLARIDHPVPLCADESCHDRRSLPSLVGRYEHVNIKLDKTGGLTEALLLREEARARGFGIMVGCLVCTSLSIAPAFLVAQGASFVDLDGPLLLSRDREPSIRYEGSQVHAPTPELWGGGVS